MSVETSQLTISQRRKKKERLKKSVVFVNSQRAETGLHFSIIKCGEDILGSFKLTPCAGCEFGCGKLLRKKNPVERYHCPLCTTSIFKPAVYCKTKKHLLNHFQGRGAIILRGYKITGCHLKCVNYSQTNQQRSHFHCPFCSDTFANKSFLIKHGQQCRLDIDDVEIVNSTQMNKTFSNAKTAHLLSSKKENKEYTNIALKIKSENTGTPKKHFKFKKLLYPNINVTISATSQNSSDINEKKGRIYPPVECTQCRQFYHPKYIYQHIRMQHDTVKSKPNISQSRHHHSVRIDSRLCLYTSAKTISGIQIPLHVIKLSDAFDKNTSPITLEDLNKRFTCESTMCMNICRAEWASGNIEYLCDHLKSVDFSVEPYNGSLDEKCQWLDKEQLNARELHGQLSENRYKMVSCLNLKAINKNTPMIVELPQAFKSYHKTKRGSYRFTFYSVYTGHVSKWSKFERTVVTIDHLRRAIHCHCKENTCVHRGSVICWLHQNEKLEVQLFEVKYKEKTKGIRQRNKLRIPRIENEMSIRIARDNTKVKIKVSKKTPKELYLKTIYVLDKDSKNLAIPCESADIMSEDKNIKIAENTCLNCDYVDKSILYENVDNLNVSNTTLNYSFSQENKHNLIKNSDLSQENLILPIVSNPVRENTDLIISNSPINIITNKVRKVFKVINIVKDDDSLFRAAGENLEDYTQDDYLELRDLVLQWLNDCDHSLYKINPLSVNVPSHGLLNQHTLSNVQSIGQIINPLQSSNVLTPISVSLPINQTVSSLQDICIRQIHKETKERQSYNLIDQSNRQKVSPSQNFQKQLYQPNTKEFNLSNELTTFQLATHNEKQYMIALSNIFSVTLKVYNNNGGCSDHIDTYTPIEGISEGTLHFRRDRSGYYDALTQTDVPDELYTVV